MNRICSRAQKGFNSKRYTQEVTINVWETIAFCKKNNIKGAVLAVDMAKAFDTVSSKFADAVYKFFGFGPVMQKWLSLLGTNRFACLILSLNSIFSTVLSPPANYWVGRYINYEKRE